MSSEHNELLCYAQQLLTNDELEALAQAGVLLYGPKGLRRYLAEQSIEAFVRLYFNDEFYLPLAPFQEDILADCQEICNRAVMQKPGVKLARALPRAHAKSSFYARILPLHGFLFNWSPLTVLLGNNEDAAHRLVANIKTAIENSAGIREDFPNIKGGYWGNEKLESSTGAVITSFGIGSGSIRGVSTGKHRPSLIIGDDLDDDKSVRSLVELANNKEWIDKSVLALGDNVSYTTSFVVIGTIIRKTSLLRYILDSPQFHSLTESAVQKFSTSALWEDWKEYILALARDNNQPKDASDDSFYQQHKAELLANTQMLWDRPDAYRQAMLYKLANERAFYSEYQNDPKSDTSGFGNIIFRDLPENIKEYHLLASYDPAIKPNDLNAWVEVLFHPVKKEMIVLYCDAVQRTYIEAVDVISARIMSNPTRYRSISIEENSAGSIIADLLQSKTPGYVITRINNRLPKNERIQLIAEYIQRGQITFYTGVDVELIKELEAFPFSTYDDGMDALANIVMFLHNAGMFQLVTLPAITGERATWTPIH